MAAGIETPRLTFFSSEKAVDASKNTKPLAIPTDLQIKFFIWNGGSFCLVVKKKRDRKSSRCQNVSGMFLAARSSAARVRSNHGIEARSRRRLQNVMISSDVSANCVHKVLVCIRRSWTQSKLLSVSVFEIVDILSGELFPHKQCCHSDPSMFLDRLSANTGERLVDKVANHDLTNRIAVFLLEAASISLKTVSIFFMIKENSDAGIRGKLCPACFARDVENTRLPELSRQTLRDHARCANGQMSRL